MEIAVVVVLLVFAVVSGVLAGFQYCQKGFLFNNAYLYASEEQRAALDKKPYYRQSAVVFTGLCLYCLLDASYFLFKKPVVFYVALAVLVLVVIYAVVSSVILAKRNRRA